MKLTDRTNWVQNLLRASHMINLNEFERSEIPAHLAIIHADLQKITKIVRVGLEGHTHRSSQAYSIALLYENFTGKSIIEHAEHIQRHSEHGTIDVPLIAQDIVLQAGIALDSFEFFMPKRRNDDDAE